MHGLQLITTADRSAWHEALDSVGRSDVFHRLAYTSVMGEKDGFACQAAWYQSSHGVVFYPFLRRDLTGLKSLESYHRGSILTTEYTDIISPYGYSGPVASNDNEYLWSDFNKAFHRFCVDSKIVTEFSRLNPFLRQDEHLRRAGGVLVGSPVFVVELNNSEKDILRQMRKGHRYSVRKAEQMGVEVYQVRNLEGLRRFSKIYSLTMERNRATKWYFFSFNFFEKLWRELGEQIELWNADFDGRTIATTLILQNGEWAHYFLSGSDPDFNHLFANHLLLYKIMLDLGKRGLAYFNLGGTYQQKEGLSLFKSGFTQFRRMFFSYRRVHIADIYQELCQSHHTYQTRPSTSGYFPAYRADLNE